MKKTIILGLWVSVFALGCSSVSSELKASAEFGTTLLTNIPRPDNLSFLPEALPDLDVPADVGTVSDNPVSGGGSASMPVQSEAFQDAYADALLRGIPLVGVLGGDRVHPWQRSSLSPGDTRQSWIQNWQSADGGANSFGFPGLVLSVTAKGSGGVYTISGEILDQFGKSAGRNMPNGVEAYGYPLGNPRFEGGAAVQDFSGGTIRCDYAGTTFELMETLTEGQSADSGQQTEDPSIPEEIREIFKTALAEGRTPLSSDGPLVSVTFAEPWAAPLSEGSVPVSSMVFNACNKGSVIAVYIDVPHFPRKVRFLSGSFLHALLRSRERIRGAEKLKAAESPGGQHGRFIRALLDGFSVYGIPLSDALPYPNPQNKDAAAGDTAAEHEIEAKFREAQRFSRGWMIADALRFPAPVADEPAAEGLSAEAAEEHPAEAEEAAAEKVNP